MNPPYQKIETSLFAMNDEFDSPLKFSIQHKSNQVILSISGEDHNKQAIDLSFSGFHTKHLRDFLNFSIPD